MPARDLTRYGWLSIGVALATMGLKLVAWWLTGSVGFLSDALESTVNLGAAVLMLLTLRVAALPPDENHQFGHDKAELFSAGAEGLMIVVAASLIVWSAVDRLLDPRHLEQVGAGVAVNVVASLANLAVARTLTRAGREHRSRALLADARHLYTDVLTSAGVVVAVVLVALTHWTVIDPIVALLVGVNIVITGGRLVWQAVLALMDPPLAPEEEAAIRDVLARYESDTVTFHALRTRMGGHRRFVSFHILVPGHWSVTEGHALVDRLEADLAAAVDHLVVASHLEPIEEQASYLDQSLDRADFGTVEGGDGAARDRGDDPERWL